MTNRENILRAIRFEQPERIPMTFHINDACWNHYEREALLDLKEAHPMLFPDFRRSDAPLRPDYLPVARKDSPYTDSWGCRWETTDDGITGSVTSHSLADWRCLDTFSAPDSEVTDGVLSLDWSEIAADADAAKAAGNPVWGTLTHGHTFLRLQDLRGYENLLFDMHDGVPELDILISIVSDFNLELVQRWLRLNPDIMSFPEDLGMQVGPMLSVEAFRRYIKPVYQRIMRPARESDCLVHMHSDGDIRTLLDDIIEGGVDVINLQDSVNGIEWIRDAIAGRICVDLDIDRQNVTRFGTPENIDQLVRYEVDSLGSKSGGLMMIYGLYPGVPLENIQALMTAMERYSPYYS